MKGGKQAEEAILMKREEIILWKNGKSKGGGCGKWCKRRRGTNNKLEKRVTRRQKESREGDEPNEKDGASKSNRKGSAARLRNPCFKMPAHTKEQVFGGLRFQAGRADGITRMLTFVDNKDEPVHGRKRQFEEEKNIYT